MSSSPTQNQNQDPNQHLNNQDSNQNQNQQQQQEQQQQQQEEAAAAGEDATKEEVKEEVKEEKNEEAKEEQKEEVKKKKEEKKKDEEEKGSWTDFFYNRRTGEILGRTASSWGLILLFYLVFYGFLAGMFTLTMWVMLQTLDDNVPQYQDRVPSPGLVIRPHATEISFNRTDPLDYSSYIQQLNDLLHRYNDSIQDSNELCMVGEYTDQDEEQVKKVCQFKRSVLRQCSGLPDTSFGYKDGKPCVIIKMNRIIGLKPKGDPYINCTAKRGTPLQMQYFPPEGRIDKMFFPYYGLKAHSDYVQPLVAVKLFLNKDDYNVEQTVECKVEGSDLKNNDERDKYLGRVTFRVTVSE